MSEEIEVVEQTNITEEDAKKALKEGNPSLAVEYYSSKLQSLVQQHGEVAPECADTYLAYGKALLSQARVEFDILGTGLNKTIEDQNKEPEPEPEQPVNTNGKKIFFNDDHVIDEKEESDDEEESGQDPANPQDTVETAWNVLEVARVIYSKLDNKLALSEVYLTLGDLSMESDNMEQAVSEYSECLALRQQVLSTDDKKLAEVHYSIALANNFLNKNKEALTHFVMSKKIFEARLTKLQSEAPDSAEIQDVKEIIADLQDKIDEFTGPMPALKAEAKEPKSQSGFSKPTMSNSTPINTLTARVKPAPPANPTPVTDASVEAKTVIKRKIEDV